jgi:hypothetical protein
MGSVVPDNTLQIDFVLVDQYWASKSSGQDPGMPWGFKIYLNPRMLYSLHLYCKVTSSQGGSFSSALALPFDYIFSSHLGLIRCHHLHPCIVHACLCLGQLVSQSGR